jgi:hypothetical protein
VKLPKRVSINFFFSGSRIIGSRTRKLARIRKPNSQKGIAREKADFEHHCKEGRAGIWTTTRLKVERAFGLA